MNMAARRTFKLFVSHTSPYADIAKRLRAALVDLDLDKRLDVKIHENMVFGEVWLNWIEEHTTSADGFILLYPHRDMKLNWPLYEVACFLGAGSDPFSERGGNHERKVVCIRNKGIDNINEVFDRYQAVVATQSELLRFFEQVFVDGIFSGKEALNPAVDSESGDATYSAAAILAAREIEQLFVEAEVFTHYHERRVVIWMQYDKQNQLVREACKVEGNEEGFKMLKMAPVRYTNWAAVCTRLKGESAWPFELDAAMSRFLADDLPPSLSPFMWNDEIYIPVIPRHDTVHDRLQRISVIFVKPDLQMLLKILDWNISESIPENVANLIRIFRLTMRARYEILTPRRDEFFSAPTPDHCLKVGRGVLADYQALRDDSKKAGIKGFASFSANFDSSLQQEMKFAREEYVKSIGELASLCKDVDGAHSPEASTTDQIDTLLTRLVQNNSRWLLLTARQFELRFDPLHTNMHVPGSRPDADADGDA